ncbi:hypothetical protein GJR95_01235 [Spirosoma endbachense]|uniref:Uncharacterized protein n=1 Tax=Spirosoma endbachense TaxID=2666025 RepID=A0A6P1WAP0_9BACT|nr:hypothetical protein GJR95_01235 [Spirosoma endbachense]
MRLNELGRAYTVDEVKQRLEKTESVSLADHIRDFVKRLDERGEKGTADNHRYKL